MIRSSVSQSTFKADFLEAGNSCVGSARPSRPIRVLVLRSVVGAGGGADSIILRTIRQIDSSRTALVVCAMRRSGDDAYDFDRRVQETGASYEEVIQGGICDRSVWRQVLSVFEKHVPDIVECHDYKASYYGWRLGARYGIPVIGTLHGWSGHKLREKYFYYPLHKLIVRSFQGIVAVSNEIAATAVRWGARPSSIRFIPNGIDVNEFRRCSETRQRLRDEMAIEPQAFVVGAVGRLATEKRFDILIDAVAQLRERGRSVLLVIAGEGDLHQSLSADIKRRKLEGICRLLGYRSDVAQLYSAFDVYVQSSDNEGTPGVLLEAMSSQLPIVATGVGGTVDLIENGENGVIVPRRSSSQLSEAIERVMDDSSFAVALARCGREVAESRFSIAARTEALQQFYQSLVHADFGAP